MSINAIANMTNAVLRSEDFNDRHVFISVKNSIVANISNALAFKMDDKNGSYYVIFLEHQKPMIFDDFLVQEIYSYTKIDIEHWNPTFKVSPEALQ